MDTTYYWVANAVGMNRRTSANSSIFTFKILSKQASKISNHDELSKVKKKSGQIAAIPLLSTSITKTNNKRNKNGQC